MFYLKGRGGNGDAKLDRSSKEDSEFGWWLGESEFSKYSVFNESTKDCRSSGSSASMQSCIDYDDTETHGLAMDHSKHESDITEQIELSTFVREKEMDIYDRVEKNEFTEESNVTQVIINFDNDDSAKIEPRNYRSKGICYTPERLVRSKEYQIIIPSPRYLSISQERVIPDEESPLKARLCQHRINYLINSKQDGAFHFNTLLRLEYPEVQTNSDNLQNHRIDDCRVDETTKDNDEHHRLTTPNKEDPIALYTSDINSNRSSYERLNGTWDDLKKLATRRSSLEDTSGIHSNDWSSETPSETQTNPPCLCDELAIASRNYDINFLKEQNRSINEVVSILRKLEDNPERMTKFLKRDSLYESISSHDRLTRLALASETDSTVPMTVGDPNNVVQRLQKKVEKLQNTNKDILKDIRNLRKEFEYDEEKLLHLSSNATKLRQEIHEVRYIDDLLNLLQEELEKISCRNWPFVLGHTKYREEINLIV